MRQIKRINKLNAQMLEHVIVVVVIAFAFLVLQELHVKEVR
jgi:hypothetical protein